MRHAYESLDEATKEKIGPLNAYHSERYSMLRRTGLDPTSVANRPRPYMACKAYLRPLVKVHPETGRKSIFLAHHAFRIPGMSPEESEQLLDSLADHAARAPRIYTHTWEPGDLVIWDNRCFMHRARPMKDPSEPRTLLGTRVAGDVESESGLPAGFGEEKLALELERVRKMEQWHTAHLRLR